MNADPNARDQMLNDLSSTLTPASDSISDTPPAPPVIPDHELIRRIGRGSYGEVWLARSALGTWRAVKIVQRAAFDHDRPYEREFEGIRRFEPISRTHPSQLNVLHVGRNDAAGHFYYVMELADAEEMQNEECKMKNEAAANPPASDRQQPILNFEFYISNYRPRTLRSDLYHRGRLPFDECLQIGLALATALDHLHRHGLVHRDIKPSNIVFVSGIPKLADIGLVARAEATLSLVGTEGYLSPEGLGTAQADIYSFGKVLYEMATGRDRQEFPELPTNLIQQPAAERAQLAELNEIILRACHTDLKERYQTAAELHAELALLQSGKSVSRMRTVERRLHFVQRAGVVVTIIALFAAGLYLWQSRQARQMKTLATEARHNELVARDNLYAADINLAHQAVMADNLRQARVLLQNHVPKPGEPDLRGFEWRYLWQQSQSEELFTLPGHEGGAGCVAFSPNGQQLATGGADGMARLWELASHREVAAFPIPGVVQSLAFFPTGDLLAIASESAVWLWDTRTFERIRALPAAFRNARFSPDGKYLLTLSTNGLMLWETATWSAAGASQTPEPRAWREYDAAFAPDGTRVAVVFNEAIRMFRLPNLQETGVLPQESTTRSFIAFSPDNRTLACPTTEFGVKLWDAASRRELRILHGHADTVYAAAFSPDGSRLATCSADQTIKLWDVATGKLVRKFKGQADEVYAVAFSPDGKRLASVGYNDGAVKLWDATAQPPAEYFRKPFGPVGFDLDGRLVAFDEHLRNFSFDPATLQSQSTNELSLTAGRAYAPFLGSLSLDGRTMALWVPDDQMMEVWDRRLGKYLCSVQATSPHVCFAPKRQLLVTNSRTMPTFTASTNQTGTVWQLPKGTIKWKFTNIWHISAISPDERLLVADEGTTWKLWEIGDETLKPRLTFGRKANPSYEKSTAFSPDGRLLATGEKGGLIRLWAMPTALEVGILSGHTRDQTALAFSPDGRTLASMCDDRTLRLWNVATRRELLRFQAPKEDRGDWGLTFSPDGRALAARRIDEDGPITWLWHAPSLAEIIMAEAKH